MLNVLGPRGAVSAKQEDTMIRRHAEANDLTYTYTPKERPATIDGFFLNRTGLELRAGFESKCRNESVESLRAMGTVLVHSDKIKYGRAICKHLCIPFILMIYTIEDDQITEIPITDRFGELVTSIEYAVTTTQATIDGGTAVRENAFVAFPG